MMWNAFIKDHQTDKIIETLAKVHLTVGQLP